VTDSDSTPDSEGGPEHPARPLALDAYETLADGYAERAPTKPFNADLERPATRSLLPDVDGLDVFDAGCGPGVTTEHLVQEGACVVAGDVSPQMLRHARERVGSDADFLRLDLGSPFPLADDSFDLVHASLCFDYVEDWHALFAEVARVLRPGGQVVCSMHHPFAEATRLEPESYFETQAFSEEWTGFGDPVDVPFYYRPLGGRLGPMLAAGFRLVDLVEARPTEQFREKRPEAYERVSREPTFLAVRGVLGG
jgi:SAM-dependent methyltransferase